MINLNSSTNWFNDDELGDGTETVIPRHDTLNIINVTQLEKDTILVCFNSKHCNDFVSQRDVFKRQKEDELNITKYRIRFYGKVLNLNPIHLFVHKSLLQVYIGINSLE